MVSFDMNEVEGMTCVVTGATSGIGRVAAAEFARCGARVVIVGRSRERGRHTLMEIMRDTGNTQVDLILADLSSQADVRRVAADVGARYPQIDVLVNNAGAIFRRREESVDGIEMTLALNHLGYFLLTNLLLDTLRSSAPCRIVNVASGAHRRARLDLDDLQSRRRYRAWRAYSNSKLCNLLFTYELARRLEGTGITVNALHPGTVATRFGSNNPGPMRRMMVFGRPFLRTPERGAETIVHLALAPELASSTGGYFVDERTHRSSRASHDAAVAARLWDLSAELTGIGR
jgi:NAD(P)-dependent dehydrogenase (short-subunit alcohol dehydrogenase family)